MYGIAKQHRLSAIGRNLQSYLINCQAQIQDEDITVIKAIIQWDFFHSDVLLHTMKVQQSWCVFFRLDMMESSLCTNKLEYTHARNYSLHRDM